MELTEDLGGARRGRRLAHRCARRRRRRRGRRSSISSGVAAGADLDAEGLHGLEDAPGRSAPPARGPVEGREQPVARRRARRCLGTVAISARGDRRSWRLEELASSAASPLARPPSAVEPTMSVKSTVASTRSSAASSCVDGPREDHARRLPRRSHRCPGIPDGGAQPTWSTVRSVAPAMRSRDQRWHLCAVLPRRRRDQCGMPMHQGKDVADVGLPVDVVERRHSSSASPRSAPP